MLGVHQKTLASPGFCFVAPPGGVTEGGGDPSQKLPVDLQELAVGPLHGILG